MAIQRLIDEKSSTGPSRGEEGVHASVSVWVAVQFIAIFDGFGRIAQTVFHRIIGAHSRGSKRKQLRLVESLALGNRRQLLLVVCNNQRYLVGAGAESVGNIVAIEGGAPSPERQAKGPELVRRKGRDATREARSRAAAKSGLDLWH